MKEEKAKKPKKVEEKKEVMEKVEKVEKKDYSIEKDNQKRLKGFSKALYIIAIIIRVFIIIGIVGVGIAMIAFPVLTNNIKAEPYDEVGNIKIFDTEIEYIKTEDKVTLYEKTKPDDKTILRNKNDVMAVTKVLDYVEKNDMTKVLLFVEFELIVVVALMVIDVIITKKAYDFFKNIYNQDSPFTLENIDIIKSTVKLLSISYIIAIVLGIINEIVLNVSLNLQLTGLFGIFAVCCLQYIFEYGYKLQKETKGRIYSE